MCKNGSCSKEGSFPNNVNELDPSFVPQPIFATLFEWVKESEAIPGIFYWQAPEWDAFVRNTPITVLRYDDGQ